MAPTEGRLRLRVVKKNKPQIVKNALPDGDTVIPIFYVSIEFWKWYYVNHAITLPKHI